MQRDHALHVQHAAGERGFARAHGIKIADRQKRELGMIEALDQLHVGEDVGVAGAINDAPVGQAHHVARGFATVNDFSVVENAAAMNRGGHGDGNRADVRRAALVHADGILRALRFQPVRGLINRDDLRREFLRPAEARRECDRSGRARPESRRRDRSCAACGYVGLPSIQGSTRMTSPVSRRNLIRSVSEPVISTMV